MGNDQNAKTASSTATDLMVFAENPFMRQPKLPASPLRRWLGRLSTLIWLSKWVKP